MPQASDEMRDLMAKYFPFENECGVDDWQPTKFLLARGYTEERGWWTKPTPSHSISDYEWHCLNFLCDEWDHAYDFRHLSNWTEPR